MKIKGKAGIVLTVLAGVGMIVTIVLTAKKAPEAQAAKEAALEAKREATGDENAKLTVIESIKAQAPCYTPVVASAVITVGGLVGSQILPQSTINDLEKWKKTYRDVTAKVNGYSNQDQQKIDQMTNLKLQNTGGLKKETFVILFDGKDIQFETTLVDVLEAEYNVNRFFAGTERITFNEMLQLFHLENVEGGDDVGWDMYLGGAWYGYCWIDFEHRRATLNGKPVTYIDMPFECHIIDDALLEEYSNHGVEGMA